MASFFNRLGHIEIISDNTRIFSTSKDTVSTAQMMRSLTDIDFKFSCKKICDMSTTSCNATVSILGLSRDTIKFLATYNSTATQIMKRRRIRIYASYMDFGENLIFDGDIITAKPSVPPDNWLEISAFVGNYRSMQLYSKCINGKIKMKDLIEIFAKEVGLGVVYVSDGTDEFNEEAEKEVAGFDCSGTKADIITSLNRLSRFIIFEDCGLLKVRLGTSKTTKTNNYSAVVSEATGMIGVPEVLTGNNDTNDGVLRMKVKTLIHPGIALWDKVYLESVYIPSANGLYSVEQIEYNGHLRGQEWCQTMQLTNSIKR